MKHTLSKRLIAMLLTLATLFGLLAIPASAATLNDSGSVKITMDGFGNYLMKKSGGTKGRCHKKTWKNPVKSMFFKGSGKRGGANK